MQSHELARLAAARIEAANDLADADDYLRGLLDRWNDPEDALDPDVLSRRIDAAKVARREAQAALDEAREAESAELTARRIEAEDAARDHA